MMRRVATPAVGVAAVAFVIVLTLATGGGGMAGTIAFVALAGAVALLARVRGNANGSLRAPVVERVGGCGLGPGIAVHAVRVADRVLVVGVSGSSITLLDTASLDEFQVAAPAEAESIGESAPSRASTLPVWLRRVGLALVFAVCTTHSAGIAAASQTDSTHQSADLSPAARGERTANSTSAETASAPPILRPASRVEVPSTGETPLGPMLWIAALALLPFVLMGLTSFVKISVVLSLLRSALGTPQVPSDPVLAGIALSLTCFVMSPVAADVWQRIGESNANLSTTSGVFAAASSALPPVRGFLERNARPEEVALFVSLSARDGRAAADPGSLGILIPAFVTSELREAFVAGFFLFLPFLVVDLVVSNILMSMGMVMVSPTTVSLPFKILLFVLIDGWPLLAKALALSYH